MGKLNNEQRLQLRGYLQEQGLSFKPLQDEIADHISCDLENRMSEGYSFAEAWQQTLGELPDHHFIIIQNNVMETINKRFTWSQGFSFLALALLLISTVFKVLHLPLAGEILLLSFSFIAVSLLVTTLSGIFLRKGKKGSIRVLALVLGIVLLLISFSFRILHLQGADGTLFLAVGILVVSLLVNTLYVYRHASGEGNLLTYLHEKYTPGIERFFLILLFPLIVYKVINISSGSNDFVGNLILLVVVFGSGLQFIALALRTMEKKLSKRNILTLSATIVSCLCLTLPFLGPILPLELRMALIALCSILSCWLAYTMEEEPKKIMVMIIALGPVIFLSWALIKLNIIPYSAHQVFFNLPILMVLIAGLLLCRKHGIMRTYLLMTIASYLFEYLP